MKHLNLYALSKVTVEDLGLFLCWLDSLPSGEANTDLLELCSSLQANRLNPLIKILEQFELIKRKSDSLAITVDGEDFALSSPAERLFIIRESLQRYEAVRRIVDRLNTSNITCLPKSVVNDAFGLNAPALFIEAEINSFISWAEECKLFGYDKNKELIFNLERSTPRGPTPRYGKARHLTLVPKAS